MNEETKIEEVMADDGVGNQANIDQAEVRPEPAEC
jgi:hypothetical protein